MDQILAAEAPPTRPLLRYGITSTQRPICLDLTAAPHVESPAISRDATSGTVARDRGDDIRVATSTSRDGRDEVGVAASAAACDGRHEIGVTAPVQICRLAFGELAS